MARELRNSLFLKLRIFCPLCWAQIIIVAVGANQTIRQASHQCGDVMIVAIVVSTVVVVPNNIEQKALHLHGSSTVLPSYVCNGFGDGALYQVGATVCKVVGTGHGRSWQTEQLAKCLLQVKETDPLSSL